MKLSRRDLKRVKIEGIEVIVEHKPRNKNSYITIERDGTIKLKTPMRLAFRINALLRSRLEWIKAKQLEQISKKTLGHTLGETILFNGEISALDEHAKLSHKIKGLHVRDEASLERTYDHYYLQQAKALLPLHVKKLSEEIELFPKEIRFRKMKRQWGNCNSKGVITLNTALMKLNKRQRDYVIAHELCHLKHMNHSRDFYALLYEVFPEAQSIEKELKSMNF